GISERQVGRCTDLLVERGWITKQQRRDKSTLYGFSWARMTQGNVRDQDDNATDVRDPATDVRDPATGVRDTATDVRLTCEPNKRNKTGNLTLLPGNESDRAISLDSETGDQHPITDIAQPDPSIIDPACPSDIGNSITPRTDI